MKSGASSDQDILAALNGIIEMQRAARSDVDLCVKTGLVFLRLYYQKLPGSVARRLTEILTGTVNRIPSATSPRGTAEERQAIAASVASDAACAQVIRAANVYRKKLGLGLLGAGGRPEETEGGINEQE